MDALITKIIPYLKAVNASPKYNFLTIRIEKQFLQISCERKRKFRISKETISYYKKIGFSEIQDFFILLLMDKDSGIKFSENCGWVKYTAQPPEKDADVIDESLMYWQYYIYPDSLEFIGEFCPPVEFGYNDEEFYSKEQYLDTIQIRHNM